MSKSVILFVHGLGGDATTTWGNFFDLIKTDPGLKDYDTASFSYPTSLFNIPFFSRPSAKIQTLADALRTQINTRYDEGSNFILVCHSLGGLIARRYLVGEIKNMIGNGINYKAELRIRGLLLYAVPNEGAGLAKVASNISWRHNQLRQLCKDSDLIRDLNEDWDRYKVAERVKVRYVVGALDSVVDEYSARSSWGQQNVDVVPDRGHIDLVKPQNDSDLSYLILKRFVISLANPPSPDSAKLIQLYKTRSAVSVSTKPVSTNKSYRVIGFDLDGTLLRGIDFSWTVVWKHLGFDEAIYKAEMRDYLKGNITYQQWCDQACKQFQTKGLRRSDFPAIVRDISVTKNLKETLTTLRASGFVLALISGGIDAFIEEKIPEAPDLFDYICINRLRYDELSKVINGVDATPFDFKGKTAALEAICTLHGCSLKEAVYVGEGFNDEDVVNKAGLSIAYPPGETAIDAASRCIKEDDLSKILEYIL